MCEVGFDFQSKLKRHFATAKHAALAGICSTTGGDIHPAPLAGIGSTTGGDVHPTTSDSDIETAMGMEVNISRLPPNLPSVLQAN